MTETAPSEQRDAHRGGSQPRIGIALGAGGAKGIAHIPMLEALDELGVTPHRVAGCSIGAVMGALYASGPISSSAMCCPSFSRMEAGWRTGPTSEVSSPVRRPRLS